MASLTLSLFTGEDDKIHFIRMWEGPDELTHIR